MSDILLTELEAGNNAVLGTVKKLAETTKNIIGDDLTGKTQSTNDILVNRYFETVRNKLFLKYILTDFEFFITDTNETE